LVKLVLAEPQSAALRKHLEDTTLCASALVRVEVNRVVARHDPRDLPRAAAVIANVRLVSLDRAVLTRAAAVEPFAVRTLDAVHVASAASLGNAVDVFVTYDDRQAEAARAAGFRVESPGT
jgi:uncharacterized protein